jgi:hypothetical protein
MDKNQPTGIVALARVVEAAKRKVAADDAVFLAGTGTIAGDFDALREEQKAADFDLQIAVRALTPSTVSAADIIADRVAPADSDTVIYVTGERLESGQDGNQ